MRARLAAVSAGSVAFAALAIMACRLTGGLTGGELPDAASEGGPDGGGGGCDADLATSLANCGACGHVCPTGPNGFAACFDGGCLLACATGYGDCDEAGANGCETNIQTSRTNCGRCAHDCLGPATGANLCVGGVCQPFMMSNSGSTPIHIATDDTYIYGINAVGTVTRIIRDGGGDTQLNTIVQGDSTPQSPPPRISYAVNAADAGALYYTSFGDAGPDGGGMGTVSTVAATGSRAVTVLATTPVPFALVASSVYVYWSEGDPDVEATGTIKRCKIGNCSPPYETVVATAPGRIYSLGLVGGTPVQLFWTNAGTLPDELDSAVYKCNVGLPCTPQPLTDSSKSPLAPFALALDKQSVFYTTLSGDVASCGVGGCSFTATVIDQVQLGPRFLQAEGANLFWTNGDGTIKSIPKVPVTGAPPGNNERTLYESRTASPWDLVVEPDAIYWTDLNGAMGNPALYRLAR
jgi:hypothetical protein